MSKIFNPALAGLRKAYDLLHQRLQFFLAPEAVATTA